MSRSRRHRKPQEVGDGCFLCTGLRKGQRRVGRRVDRSMIHSAHEESSPDPAQPEERPR